MNQSVMMRVPRLNTTLLPALGQVLGKTHAELMETTGIKNTTWYHLMGHPDGITVQQLISIANGLHIPVRRFFSIDDIDVIGSREDYIVNPYKPCYYDGKALQHLFNLHNITWQGVANVLGISRIHLRKSLLSVTRLPVARFLSVCETFGIEPFIVIVDPNAHRESNRQRSDMLSTFMTSQNDAPLPENFIEMRVEIAKLRKQLFDTKNELDILRRNQKNNNNMAKKEISEPITWFYDIRFQYYFKDMNEPVRAWFQVLVERPHEAFFYAKTGQEYNTICFYTENGFKFFEAGCQPPLSDCLFREKIMVGKISANTMKDNPDAIEFVADLVANLKDDRKDTAELAKFRRYMIQKFG